MGMKLVAVMLDTHRTRMAIIHENEAMPYRRRIVQIELTPEQAAQLTPRHVGSEGGQQIYEEIGDVWIEQEGE